MSEKKSFWQTFPGVITGIAAILTAMAGILPFVLGGDDGPDPSATTSPTPTETGSPSPSSTSPAAGGSTQLNEPVAVVAPKSIDFGDGGVRRQLRQTVTVANSGSEYLVVEEVTITGRTEVFTVENTEECLAETGIEPGSECELAVVFTPTSAGSYAGILEIEHSADGSPARVALNGEGVFLQL
jgi:hypothetical protein